MHDLLLTEDLPLLGDDELSGMSQGELDILVSMLDCGNDDHYGNGDTDVIDIMHEPVSDWVVPAPQEPSQEEYDNEMDEDFQPGSDDSLAATWLTPAQRETRRSPRGKTKRRTKIRRKEVVKRRGVRRTPRQVFLERVVLGHMHTAQVQWTESNLALLWNALKCPGSVLRFIGKNPQLFKQDDGQWIPTPQCIASVS